MDPRILSDLLRDIEATGADGLSVAVQGVAYRSDRVEPGDVFVCVPGFVHDGHDFAADAVARGASVVVAKHALPGIEVPVVVVEDPRRALAVASARLFGDPSAAMRVVGITGTNGKTTTTYLLDSILRAAGERTGLIGTVGTVIDGVRQPASRTTPESRDLQELLARMRDAGVGAVTMEVSSHALDLRRVDAMTFAAVAFTNLSQDHLDHHRTMEEYFAAKARLFREHVAGARVIDIDGERGRELAADVGAEWTVGRSSDARLVIADVRLAATSSSFSLAWDGRRMEVASPLAGAFNVSNAALAAGCALALGVDAAAIVAGLASAPQVPGRMERVDAGQAFPVLVDYAHTPDALAKAIAAVREVTPGRVITVFGCGGDRDPDKRAPMGRAAGEGSDVVVVTVDNPRSEDPVGIILQIEDGLAGLDVEHHTEPDRRRAIALALSMARPGDAVLLAGKGHEDYQIFSDRTVHFDDREVAAEELAVLAGSVASC